MCSLTMDWVALLVCFLFRNVLGQTGGIEKGVYRARAKLYANLDPQTVWGYVDFVQDTANRRIVIKWTDIQANGVTGPHGFHINNKGIIGTTSTACGEASGHYNPLDFDHGSPFDKRRHIGDLGNMDFGSFGISNGQLNLEVEKLPLTGPYSIVGRLVVIHVNEDDMGRGNFPDSKLHGHSGQWLACGVVGIVTPEWYPAGHLSGGSADYPRQVEALIMSGDGHIVYGKVIVNQESDVSPIKVTGTLNNIETEPHGKHGLHVHELGDLTDGCYSSSSHFNPKRTEHGNVYDEFRHLSDLGNIQARNGTAFVDVTLPPDRFPLVGPHAIVGRTLVLHSRLDDLERGTGQATRISGNAGQRIGCGVLGVSTTYNPAGEFPEGF